MPMDYNRCRLRLTKLLLVYYKVRSMCPLRNELKNNGLQLCDTGAVCTLHGEFHFTRTCTVNSTCEVYFLSRFLTKN